MKLGTKKTAKRRWQLAGRDNHVVLVTYSVTRRETSTLEQDLVDHPGGPHSTWRDTM